MSNQDLVITTDGLSHFKVKQDLENENKFKKKNDATDLKGAVRYDAAQVLNEQEKAQARANIGAAAPGEGGGGSAEGAVLYTEQALTAEQQSQARANIGTTDGTWESMPDKPFGGSGVLLELPSDTSKGVVSSQKLEALGIPVSVIKVSDTCFASPSEIYGATAQLTVGEEAQTFTVEEGDIQTLSNGFAAHRRDSGWYLFCININSAGTSTLATEDVLGEDLVFAFTEPGIYLLYTVGMAQANYLKNGEIKRIDKKYLPEEIVTTDGNGLIPTSMLPSYVDDVIEGYYNTEDSLFYEEAGFTTELTGETGKIYTDLASRDIYRWSGSVFVQINPKTYRIATNDEIDALFSK